MISSNIKQFLTNNKKIFYYLWFFLVIFSMWIDSTFAAVSESEQEMMETITALVNGMMMWISVMLALITYLATAFLSPEWINGTIFWLNWYFKNVWILVSNIVYFIFAFILIWIAFMNIIWKNTDQFQLKQALPKFAIWVFIVPVSWFLVQFILSISAILTISALTLPFNTFPEFDAAVWKIKIPQSCTLNLTSFTNTQSSEWSMQFIDCPKENPILIETVINGWDSYDSIFWVISLYTYWVLSFDRIDDVNFIDLKNIITLWDLIVKIVFDLIFVLVYAILMIALWMVLMTRWIYIWIYTMFSPVFWLMFFFDKKDWAWEWFFAKFNAKEFIALAMVPVYSMLALSFWMLFIFVTWTWMAWERDTTDTRVIVSEDGSKFSVWSFDLIIKWSISSWQNVTGLLQEIWGGTLGVIWSLILKVFGIVILWWAVMAALRTSDITKAIVQPLHDFGSKVWQIASSAPANIPIFDGQSMSSLNTAAGSVQSSINQKAATAWTELWSKFSWDNDFIKGVNTHSAASDVNSKQKSVDWAIQKSNTANASELKQINEMIKKLLWVELNLTSWMGERDKATEWQKVLNDTKSAWKFTKQWTPEYKTIDNIIHKMNSNPSAAAPTWDTSNNIKPKLDIQPNKTIINFNWTDKQVKTYDETNRQVTELWDNVANSLAKYVGSNNLNTNELDDLFSNLSLDNWTKWELDKYFWKKDWKIIFSKTEPTDSEQSSVDDYVTQNNPTP